jgi:hypothetical protein
MIRPIAVTALPNYHIHIAFSDAVEGEVDLSDLPGQGVFEAWKDQGFLKGYILARQADSVERRD